VIWLIVVCSSSPCSCSLFYLPFSFVCFLFLLVVVAAAVVVAVRHLVDHEVLHIVRVVMLHGSGLVVHALLVLPHLSALVCWPAWPHLASLADNGRSDGHLAPPCRQPGPADS
jgi:hypothetical protein